MTGWFTARDLPTVRRTEHYREKASKVGLTKALVLMPHFEMERHFQQDTHGVVGAGTHTPSPNVHGQVHSQKATCHGLRCACKQLKTGNAAATMRHKVQTCVQQHVPQHYEKRLTKPAGLPKL